MNIKFSSLEKFLNKEISSSFLDNLIAYILDNRKSIKMFPVQILKALVNHITNYNEGKIGNVL